MDQITGVGTLIKPGDHVDVVTGITGADKVPLVMYNQASPKPGQTINPGPGADQTLKYNPTTVKTLVEGLQVLGTLLPPPSSNATPAPSDGADRRAPASTASSRS